MFLFPFPLRSLSLSCCVTRVLSPAARMGIAMGAPPRPPRFFCWRRRGQSARERNFGGALLFFSGGATCALCPYRSLALRLLPLRVSSAAGRPCLCSAGGRATLPALCWCGVRVAPWRERPCVAVEEGRGFLQRICRFFFCLLALDAPSLLSVCVCVCACLLPLALWRAGAGSHALPAATVREAPACSFFFLPSPYDKTCA